MSPVHKSVSANPLRRIWNGVLTNVWFSQMFASKLPLKSMHFPPLLLAIKQPLLSMSIKQLRNLKRKNLSACCRRSCHKLSRMSFLERVCFWTWLIFVLERWQSDLLSKPRWNRTFLFGLKCKFYCNGIQNNGQNCLVSQIDAQTVNKGLLKLPSDKTSAFQLSVWKFRVGDKIWNGLLG